MLYKIFTKSEQIHKLLTKKKLIVMGFVSLTIYCIYFISEIGFLLFFFPDFNNTISYYPDNIGVILAHTIFFPIAEELINRGILLNHLNKNHSFFISNIIQAIIFGMLHFNISLFLLFLAFGLIIGIIKKYTNIYYAIFIHIMNNVILCFLATYAIRFPDMPKYGYLFMGILFLHIIIYLLFVLKKLSRELI